MNIFDCFANVCGTFSLTGQDRLRVKRQKYLCQSFPFSASKTARVLILGSIPGKKSLEEQQYYAHSQNQFWEIMDEIFGASRNLSYPARLKRLCDSQIALWDVVYRCERKGSLDHDIDLKTVMPNNFQKLFQVCPRIHSVFFNGKKAEVLFRRFVLPNLDHLTKQLPFKTLPSTSPAHASLTKIQKRKIWEEELRGVL